MALSNAYFVIEILRNVDGRLLFIRLKCSNSFVNLHIVPFFYFILRDNEINRTYIPLIVTESTDFIAEVKAFFMSIIEVLLLKIAVIPTMRVLN